MRKHRESVIWIKIVLTIDHAHMRCFLKSPAFDYTVFIIESANRIFVTSNPERYVITTVFTFDATIMKEFDFFSHAVLSMVISIGIEFNAFFAYSYNTTTSTATDKNIL